MSSFEYSLPNKIMATDLYIFLNSDDAEIEKLKKYVNTVVEMLLKFEEKYSRFRTDNIMHDFNTSETSTVDDDLYEMLVLSKKYFEITNGIFDPSIHDDLVYEGYNVSKNLGFYDHDQDTTKNDESFSITQLELYKSNLVKKPRALKIDLGGIGKGYILKIIQSYLDNKIENYCVSLGGDMFVKGKDIKHNYDFWAIEVEKPDQVINETPTIIVTDDAIATSGTYKRNWIKDKTHKNHLIDTKTQKSTDSDIVSSTVIDKDIIFADVMAKVLLIMGKKQAVNYSRINSLAAIFITGDNKIHVSEEAKSYIWH